MDEKNQLLNLIKELEWSLLKYHVFRFFQYALFFSVIAVFLLAMLARWFIITNLSLWIVVLSFFVIAGVAFYWYQNRPTIKTAISLYDDEVMENRVVTAFSFLDDTNELSIFQRKDALNRMKISMQRVKEKQKAKFYWKELFLSFLLLAGTIVSFLYPSEQMLAASDIETNKELLKEVEDEVDSMDEPEDEALKELLDNLKEKLHEVENAEEALKELLLTESIIEDMKLELQAKEEQLQQVMDQFGDLGLNEITEALKDLNESALQDALKNLDDQMQGLTEGQKQQLTELIEQLTTNDFGAIDELSEEELEELLKQLEEQLAKLMDENLDLAALLNLQQQLQATARSLNVNMTNAGLSDNPSLTFSNENLSNQSNNGNSEGGSQGEGSNSEPGDSNSGNGNGNNGSNQDSNGSGSGSSQSSGSSSSSGGQGEGAGSQGAGTGQGSRELVTIPERITSDTNMETDDGALGTGEGERQQSETAPVLQGTVRPYQEVIGSYENSYRESINRMQLPRYLEGIVRDYFSELNLEQE